MNILILHQYYLRPGQPGGSRFNEFAAHWSARGHHVTVVAGTVNYATGERFEGFGRSWNTFGAEANVAVWRCYVPTTYNSGYIGRAWAFLGFSMSSLTAVLRAKNPDVIIATSPPLTTGPTGWLASLWHRCPWVFEIRDLWPESAITTGVVPAGGVMARFLFAIERLSCRRANRVNVLTPAFRANLVERQLVPDEKVVFVPNGADVDAFVPGDRNNTVRKAEGWDDRCVAIYAGAHGRANGLMQLVDAADHLRHRPDVLIVCVGDGPERRHCEEQAKLRGLDNIRFLGSKAKEDMPAYVQAADIGVAVLQRNVTFRTVYPNKVFDYMACAKPTVLGIDGVARTLVCDQAGAGIFVEPEDGLAIATAIMELADDPGRRDEMGRLGRAWVEQNASRRSLADRYLSILEELAAPRPQEA